jgi:hypothetical protein
MEMANSKVLNRDENRITGYSVIAEILLSKTIEKKKQNDN